jgi:hypothetical protein
MESGPLPSKLKKNISNKFTAVTTILTVRLC